MKTIQIQISEDSMDSCSVYIHTNRESYCIDLYRDKIIMIRKDEHVKHE